MGPLTYEVLAGELVRERMLQARQAELAAQLPKARSRPLSSQARQHLAGGLRRLATRLDPNLTARANSSLAATN